MACCLIIFEINGGRQNQIHLLLYLLKELTKLRGTINESNYKQHNESQANESGDSSPGDQTDETGKVIDAQATGLSLATTVPF